MAEHFSQMDVEELQKKLEQTQNELDAMSNKTSSDRELYLNKLWGELKKHGHALDDKDIENGKLYIEGKIKVSELANLLNENHDYFENND